MPHLTVTSTMRNFVNLSPGQLAILHDHDAIMGSVVPGQGFIFSTQSNYLTAYHHGFNGPTMLFSKQTVNGRREIVLQFWKSVSIQCRVETVAFYPRSDFIEPGQPVDSKISRGSTVYLAIGKTIDGFHISEQMPLQICDSQTTAPTGGPDGTIQIVTSRSLRYRFTYQKPFGIPVMYRTDPMRVW
ncbi:hypothetical protein HYPSUDRAFT_398533 [Hypholoma sublateritium FD-334 SS-4]|uniref:Uncharacterized protein n=1 Tax=Hypholoma sublateritium (strain FD-334 SS-4) TaxID=945553 RepID=A0A0D2KKI4_HYPSF|nr:hypothetical protein HYPSUDRAFT_398533 [Hypholoma sublateritium FD-334 SS-4]